MAGRTPEGGTLIIAALLILSLGFAGYWIMQYAQTGGPPDEILPWFMIGAAAIIIVGMATLLIRGGGRGS